MVFFIYPVGIYKLIKSVNLDFLKRLIILSFYFTCLCVITEFFLNILGVHIQDYIIRERETSATISTFFRSYGFSTEPGSLSYYLNSLGPLSIYFSKNKNVTYSLYSLALFVTFSPVGILIWLIYTVLFQRNLLTKYTLFFGISLILFIFNQYQNEIYLIFDGLIFKVTDGGTSKTERINSYVYYLNSVKSNIFGYGLGNATKLGITSPKNFFLFVFYELGFLGLIVILIPAYYIYILKNNKFKSFFIFSLSHLLFISQVQYPYTVFLFVFIYYLKINNYFVSGALNPNHQLIYINVKHSKKNKIISLLTEYR